MSPDSQKLVNKAYSMTRKDAIIKGLTTLLAVDDAIISGLHNSDFDWDGAQIILDVVHQWFKAAEILSDKPISALLSPDELRKVMSTDQ